MTLALASLAVLACWFVLSRIRTVNLTTLFLSPDLAGLMFLSVSAVGFPVLWRLGVGGPWEDLADPTGAVVATTSFVVVASVGIALGRGRPIEPAHIVRLNNKQGALLALVGVAGLLLLRVAQPGLFSSIGQLIRRQGDELTAGLGPVYALLLVPLWAVLLMEVRSWSARAIWLCNVFVFLSAVFITGQKSRFVILAFVLGVRYFGLRSRRSRVFGSTGRLFALLVAGSMVVAITTAYQVNVRGTGELTEVPGVSEDGSSAYLLEYAVVRFGLSTFDVTRTLGAVWGDLEQSPPSLGGLVGSVLSPIPSSIVEKPPPSSHLFTQTHFPQRWAAGTGIPPSLPAELTWYFGGQVAMLIVGVLFFAVSRTTRKSAVRSPWASAVILFSSPAYVILLKAGIDGGIRLIVLLLISGAIVRTIARLWPPGTKGDVRAVVAGDARKVAQSRRAAPLSRTPASLSDPSGR